MVRRLPSLNALKAFEAAARLNSFSIAAAELYVTHAAVSRHIRELEATLGTKLFHRTGRGVELTPHGRQLSVDVTPAFEILIRAAERFTKPQGSGQLVISADPSFAAMWLLPRLSLFTAQHSGVHVVLDPDYRLVDFSKYEAHLGIRYGKGKWRDVEALKIANSRGSPVCSPSLLKACLLKSPSDLERTTLLAEDSHELWKDWLQLAGAGKAVKAAGPILKGHLAIAAAEAGQGVAIADDIQSVDGILAGRLVRPFATGMDMKDAYYLVRRSGTKESRVQAAFRVWLQQEIAESLAQLAVQPMVAGTKVPRPRGRQGCQIVSED